METILLTFQFACGQWVRWRTLDGPRYRVRKRRYVEDEGGGERYEYLLHTPTAHGYDFWSKEEYLFEDSEGPPL